MYSCNLAFFLSTVYIIEYTYFLDMLCRFLVRLASFYKRGDFLDSFSWMKMVVRKFKEIKS